MNLHKQTPAKYGKRYWQIINIISPPNRTEEINELVDILSLQAEVVEPMNVPNEACRDPNDLAVIGTLLAATQGVGVASLITGDKDLLSLADRFNVFTASEFCLRFGL